MGEIDTKSIESVQTALSLFGDKGDQKKYKPVRNLRDCENELEELSKDFANCKLQLEAKHAAHVQALFKLEQQQKMIHELSTLLKKSDIERNKYMNECTGDQTHINELESKMKQLDDQHLENAKVQEQLSHALGELKATQRELLNKETELVAARESELDAQTKAEQMETAFKIEKEKHKELLQKVKELNEAIHMSKLAAIKAEKEKFAILSEKDENIELATKATAQAQKELEDMRQQVEMLQGLENQLMEKSALANSLQLEHRQVNEVAISSEESASKNYLNQFHTDLELKEKKIMDRSVYIEALKMELDKLKEELINTKEEVNGLNINIESLTGELQKAQADINLFKERELEAQVEIALLKSRLQEGRLMFAGIEAAEERDESAKSGLFSVEAGDIKEKDQRVKQRERRMVDKTGYVVDIQPQDPSQEVENDNSKLEAEVRNNVNNNNNNYCITIPLEEYESLIRESQKVNEVKASRGEVGSQSELALLKKELEVATIKIGELRARAEQALSRAELAEKARAVLEDKLKRQKEQKQRRRAAPVPLKEESTPKQFCPSSSYETPKMYQPLGKVLNMKF